MVGPPAARTMPSRTTGLVSPALGYSPVLDLGVVGNVVQHGEGGHLPVVELQVRDAGRVGTPPVAAEVAAAVDLFLVHPVQLAVADPVAAVGRQRELAAVLDVHDNQVAAAHERDEPTVGAERYLALGVRRRRKAPGSLRADVVVVEAVGEGEDQRRAIPVRHVARLPGDPPCVGRGQTGQRGHRRFERSHVVERCALARDRVHPDQRAAEGVPRRASLDVVPVVEPGQPERRVAVEVDPPRGGIDVGDGQRTLLRLDRCRNDPETGGHQRHKHGGSSTRPRRTGGKECRAAPRSRNNAVEQSCATHGAASRPI